MTAVPPKGPSGISPPQQKRLTPPGMDVQIEVLTSDGRVFGSRVFLADGQSPEEDAAQFAHALEEMARQLAEHISTAGNR